jgi:hypothetical protein
MPGLSQCRFAVWFVACFDHFLNLSWKSVSHHTRTLVIRTLNDGMSAVREAFGPVCVHFTPVLCWKLHST